MVFSSIIFIYFFLPIVLLIYYISPKKIPIDVPVPKDFEKISIAASSDDMEIIRTELKNISDKLSEESKLILLKILGTN